MQTGQQGWYRWFQGEIDDAGRLDPRLIGIIGHIWHIWHEVASMVQIELEGSGCHGG
jgi:hypothetical protein